MEIKIKIFGAVYSICFGHETPWFSQVSFIVIAKEHWRKGEVEYAEVLWRS